MDRLGLSDADFATFLAAAALPHNVDTSVDLTTHEGTLILSFDQGRAGGDRDVTVTDGSVTVDSDTSVGRVLELTVADPHNQLIVAQAANYTDRSLRVSVNINVPALGRVIKVYVFTGPIISAPRAGEVVQFTAHGKARFGMHGIRDGYTVKAGQYITTAIRQILLDLTGEPLANMGDIIDLPDKLEDDLFINFTHKPWTNAQELAATLSRHLCYDGSGRLRFQRTDLTNPVYTFTSAAGQPGMVSSPPVSVTSFDGAKNSVRVVGGVPSGGGSAPVAFAFADPSNPFSAQSQGRRRPDGSIAGAYFWDEIYRDHMFTQAEVQRVADAALARDLQGNYEAKFESLPMYVFDELDLVAISTNELQAQTRLRQFTIPLNLDGAPTTSYGFAHRISSDHFARYR